jgi:hypothetical protein
MIAASTIHPAASGVAGRALRSVPPARPEEGKLRSARAPRLLTAAWTSREEG